MIQFQQKALFVCHNDGRIEPLDVQDLVRCLAADPQSGALELDPSILEKVVESIVQHFRNELKREHVPLGEFIQLAQTLLMAFAGSAVPKRAPLVELDLFETARRCGIGFELEFFSELRRFVAGRSAASTCAGKSTPKQMRDSPSQTTKEATSNAHLQIVGLRRCAKYLLGRRRWSKRCSEMRDEIVEYIRKEATRNGADDLCLVVLS